LLVPRDEPAGLFGTIARRAAEQVFLDLLDKITVEGRPASESSRAGNYAPRLFASRPERSGHTERDFKRAMEQLFADGRITAETYGRADQDRRRIVRTAPAEVENAT
jgi:hypothetical protein